VPEIGPTAPPNARGISGMETLAISASTSDDKSQKFVGAISKTRA